MSYTVHLKEIHFERCYLLGFNSFSECFCEVAEAHVIQHMSALQGPGRPLGLMHYIHAATMTTEDHGQPMASRVSLRTLTEPTWQSWNGLGTKALQPHIGHCSK